MAEVHVHQLVQYGRKHHGDDYQYGGAGMVMQWSIANCIEDLQRSQLRRCFCMTPDGKRYNQSDANQLSMLGNIMIIWLP